MNFDNVSFGQIDGSLGQIRLATSVGGWRFRFGFEGRPSGAVVEIQYAVDSAPFTSATSQFAIPAGDTCLELRAIRETSSSADDGILELLINGISQVIVSDVDNFSAWASGIISRTRISFDSFNVNTTGQLFIDEWILDDSHNADLGCTISIPTLTVDSSRPMDVNADGTNLYLALLSDGIPIAIQFPTDLLSDGTTVFSPVAGTHIGVQCGRFNANIIYVAGDFDGVNTVEKSSDGGSSFVVIDDGNYSFVGNFIVGPDNDDRLLFHDVIADAIVETTDSGGRWVVLNSALGDIAIAFDRLPQNVQEMVIASDTATAAEIMYSINSGTDTEDYSSGFPTSDAFQVILL
jgi:hypothetical protein